MARTGMSLEEKVKQSRQVGMEAATPTINQLAASQGIGTGTTAISAPPRSTPDQVKMMGTPAQKGAKIAAAGGETQLEQAVKLRAPAESDAETESKKRQAAALAGALGPMGDKVNQLVDAAMARITGQQVEGAPADSGLQVKVNSAAEVIKNLTTEAQTEVADLVARIGANPNDTAALNRLNVVLGRTADTAIGANDIPALMTAAPDIVKAAAGAAVTKQVGDKITLSDLGELGVTQEGLADLLRIPVADIPNLTLTDLQNKLATLQQAEFGASQQVQAGMSSALLSATERGALRDVLATMEETGLAGAEFQVGQIGKDIADGRQITVGNETYTVEELLSSPAMTDIVTQILNDPNAKTDFVKALKETNPGLYNWVISSKAGLETLVTGAATGAGKYKATQQANIKLLEPLAKFKDAFAKAGVNISALRDVNLTEEVTLPDGSKGQRWQLPEKDGGLPALAKAVLTAPPEKQATVASSISQLPPGEVAGLDAGQLAALGLDSPTGLWSDWKRMSDTQAAVAAIPDNQPARIFTTLGLGDFDQANAMLAQAVISEAMGGPRHPVQDLDTNKDGKLDAQDMPALKERAKSVGVPTLQQAVTSGNIPKIPLPNVNTPVNYGNNAIETVAKMLTDGSISKEEQDALASSPLSADVLQTIIDRQPSGFSGAGDIKPSLEIAIQRKVNNEIDTALGATGTSINGLNNTAELNQSPLSFKELQKNIQSVSNAITQAKRAMDGLPSSRAKTVLQTYINRLEITKENMDFNAQNNLSYSQNILV